MKIAFHFTVLPNCYSYGYETHKVIFKEILNFRTHLVNSKIATGDLLIWDKINTDNKEYIIEELIQLKSNTWKKFDPSNIPKLTSETIYIVSFESISKNIADALHDSLLNYPNYIGAYEIDDSNRIQWIFYGELIGYRFRIENRNLYLLMPSEEEAEETYKKNYAKFGFESVQFEFTNLRYTIFDDNHNYENARRLAEWKNQADDLLSTIIDSIISKLTDVAPDLGDKLWAMVDTYQKSETTEQLAQVMASCRRVFEYVVNCIFPPTNEIIDGHSLKEDKYKNRLFQFASDSAKSETNISLILAGTGLLFKQWEKLYSLANKGVHQDVYRHETRRCLIRTIMLLDDIVSLKSGPFTINTTTTKSLNEFIKKMDDRR